ncbi:sigma factor-like helix-turn-helix DNA-binding protein [Halomonas sp. AOP13-D3-9]
MRASDLDAKIFEINTQGKYKKLIKRLSFGVKEGYVGNGSETELRSILDEDESVLRKIPYFGVKYLELFRSLKQELSSSESHGLLRHSQDERQWEEILSLADSFEISQAQLPLKTIAALKKFSARGFDVSIQGLLMLQRGDLTGQNGVGPASVNHVLNLRQNCISELDAHIKGDLDIDAFESRLVIPRDKGDMGLSEIDEILIEDLDSYLDKISEIEALVFCKRLGFTDKKCTLQEIGEEVDLTRERVRQIEKKIIDNFNLSKRISSSSMKIIILENLSLNIASGFPCLSECFDNESDFLSFLGTCANGLNIKDRLRPDLDKSILIDIFTSHGFPITKPELLEFLEPAIEADFSLDLVLEYLSDNGDIQLKSDLCFPGKLNKSDAIAGVLAKNKRGLPWKDAGRIINSSGVCAARFDPERIDSSAFNDSENVYLAGKGIYRHTKFLPIEKSNFECLIKIVKNKLEEYPRNVAHLMEVIEVSDALKEVDYYGLRYIIKMFGPDFGLFFNGKSQSDSISLQRKFQNVNQKDVILERLRSSQSAMTKSEIAQLIKSKSLFHAALYIDEMTYDKKIIQVDRMLYTTPEQAFDNIDVGALSEFLSKRILSSTKPVHPSSLAALANSEFGYSYNWKFYNAFLKFWTDDLSLHRASHFFSKDPITFQNFVDLLNKNVHSEVSLNTAIKIINEHVCVERLVAERAFWNWRNAKE